MAKAPRKGPAQGAAPADAAPADETNVAGQDENDLKGQDETAAAQDSDGTIDPSNTLLVCVISPNVHTSKGKFMKGQDLPLPSGEARMLAKQEKVEIYE